MGILIPIISEFDSKGIDKAIKEFNQLEGAGAKAGFALKKAALPAAAAIAGLAAVLGSATKAAAEDAQAQEVLALTLRNSTGATDKQLKATEDMIGAMAVATGVADDQLRPAFANLARGTGDLKRSQELLQVAMDVSTATGKDLESVTLALSKAENGQLDALKKLGIPLGENALATKALEAAEKELTKATEAHDKLLDSYAGKLTITDAEAAKLELSTRRLDDATQGVAEASKLAGDFSEDLAKTFGGATAAAAETAAGKMAILKVRLDETKESIGAALLPVVQKFLDLLLPLAQTAQNNSTLFLVFAGVIGTLSAAILIANTALKVYKASLVIVSAAQAVFNFLLSANPIGLAVIAIAALVAAFVVLETRFGAVSSAIKIVGDVFDFFLITPIKILLGLIGKLVSALGKIPGVGALGNLVGGAIKGIPGLAAGGIVTQPTLAMIGEAGPEAVIPLNRLGSSGGGVTVNVMGGLATSADIGQAVVNAIRAYNRSAGPANIQVA